MLVHSNITVGTIPTLLATIPKTAGYIAVQINNRDNQAVYVGDINITHTVGATGGSTIAAGGSIQFWVSGGDKIYAVAGITTGTGALSVVYSYTPADYPV
jgi:hypothetical protein